MIKLKHKETGLTFDCYNIENNNCLLWINRNIFSLTTWQESPYLDPVKNINYFGRNNFDTCELSLYYQKEFSSKIINIKENTWQQVNINFFEPYFELYK